MGYHEGYLTLGRKTVVIVALSLTSAVLVLSGIGWFYLYAHVARAEVADTRGRVQVLLNAFEDERDDLSTLAEDYGAWDETYAFAGSGDAHYLSELPAAGQGSVHVDLEAILDSTGHLTFARAIDRAQHLDLSAPKSFELALADPRIQAITSTGKFSGLLVLPEGLLLVVGRPILTGARAGPPRGTFVFGRYLDSRFIEELARLVGVPVRLMSVAGVGTIGDLSAANPLSVRVRDRNTIEGQTLLQDLFGRPAGVLGIEMPRAAYAQVREGLLFLTSSLAVVVVVSTLLALFLLEHFVLYRVRRLGREVNLVARSASAAGRVTVFGEDELASLADAVNGMLEALQTSTRRLAESEGKLRDIVEHSTNVFYSRSPSQELLYMSPQARTYFDAEPSELPARWTDLVSAHPDNARGLSLAEKAVSSGEKQEPYELELVARGGRKLWVEVNEAPVVRGHETVAVVGALSDITSRKAAELEKARLGEWLRQSQKMEAVGRLAGGVAHDFNNLLGVIIGYGSLALRATEPNGPIHKNLDQILEAANRAAALTQQLLAFSRRQVLEPKILNLNDIVLDVQRLLQRLLAEHITVEVELQPDLASVKADSGQLEQVVMILALNARDALARGGVLGIATRNVALPESTSNLPAGCYVRLTVRDNGVGMGEEAMAHLFEPFFTSKERGRGTGLGLATAYGIVSQSGGTIQISSEVGQGTLVTVLLPRVAGDSEEALPEEPRKSESGTETVLLVEDEVALLELVQELLEAEGYSVLATGDPGSARALCDSHPGRIHLLLTDVIMPGLNGQQLAQSLCEARPDLKVLYMSGYTDDALGEHGFLRTDQQLLRKPFTPEMLASKVREVLGTAN